MDNDARNPVITESSFLKSMNYSLGMARKIQLIRESFRKKRKQDAENLIEAVTRTLLDLGARMTNSDRLKRKKKKNKKSAEPSAKPDAAAVTIHPDEQPSGDQSNVIHVGGIADFHEGIRKKVFSIKKTFKSFREEMELSIGKTKV